MSKRCWKKGADRLAQLRVATNLQFVKNTVKLRAIKQGMPLQLFLLSKTLSSFLGQKALIHVDNESTH